MEKYIPKNINIESVVSCFDADYENPYYYAGEFHPFWELVYVKSGTVNVSGDERVYKLQKDDIIFHKPMEFHRIWSDNNNIHAFIIAFRASGKFMSLLENRVQALNSDQSNKLNVIRKYLKENFNNQNKQYHKTMFENWNLKTKEIQIYGNMLENFLLSVISSENVTVKISNTTEFSAIYKDIINELNSNIYGWITLDEIAHKFSFSKSQIKRIFSMYSDIGIHKYFIKLKITMSIRLLGKGESIGNISQILSFSNRNYFSAVFKRETGYSPSEYKEKVLGI